MLSGIISPPPRLSGPIVNLSDITYLLLWLGTATVLSLCLYLLVGVLLHLVVEEFKLHACLTE